MKTRFTTTAILAVFFMLISTSGMMAAAPGHTQQNAKETVRRQIIQYITCPDFLTKDTEVKAIVQVDENGNVNVQEINAESIELRDYVLSQIKDLKVKSGLTEKFVLIIKFKTA